MSDYGADEPDGPGEHGFPVIITTEWLEEMQGNALWPESVLQTTGTMFLETLEQEPSGVVSFITLIFQGHLVQDGGERIAWTLPVSMSGASIRQLAIELLESTEGVQANQRTVHLDVRRRDDDAEGSK